MRSLIPVAAALLAGPALAQTAAPSANLADEGRRLAEQWCSACHAVAPNAQPPQGDSTPGFAGVAAMPSTTEMSLRVFLQTPHAGMPNFQLSRQQTDAVVAYILSLRR
ncbi:MAG: cytochrome c [Acetobacteraceae bacterium]|nr:cytochrome c [Acetobacteraceae bacterium]